VGFVDLRTLEIGEKNEVATLRQTVEQTGVWLKRNVARHGKSMEKEGSAMEKARRKRNSLKRIRGE